MRKALGAGRRRVIAQLLTESVLFSSSGGCCGVLLTFAGVRLILHLVQPLATLFPPEAVIAVNLPVLIFSVGVSMLTAILCGLWPALRGRLARKWPPLSPAESISCKYQKTGSRA
jgi:ABC-type antimicrobial peptide transport system permease subunit